MSDDLSHEFDWVKAFASKDYDNVKQQLASLQKHNDIQCQLQQYDFTHLVHCAAASTWMEMTLELISDYGCDPRQKDGTGRTALHMATKGGNLALVRYLVKECQCIVDDGDNYGRMPLHFASARGHLPVVQYLVKECRCSLNVRTKFGRTPVHSTAWFGQVEVMKFLLHVGGAWFAEDKDNDELTPLHWAAGRGHLKVVVYLVSECHVDVMAMTKFGDTAFDLACAQNHDNQNISVIEYLLSVPVILDAFKKNNTGRRRRSSSPPLLRSQGDATVMYNKFEKVYASHPVGSFVSIFLLGNPNAGKTTLCEVIKRRSSIRLFVSSKVKKSKVKLCTAGIVPNQLCDQTLGNVVIHDFAGQPEYYSSHSAVLESLLQNSGAVFVIVINLTEDLPQQVRFWLSIVANESKKVSTSKCPIVVIGSHADEVKEMLQKKIFDLKAHFSKLVLNKEMATLPSVFPLDCRLRSSSSLHAFADNLSHLCAAIRNEQSVAISLYCNFLYSILEARISKNNKVCCTLQNLLSLCDQSRQEGIPLPDDIVPSLKTLHSTGLMVYLENTEVPMKSWIVVHKEVLLAELNGVLFAPPHFIEHRDIASSTGIITSHALQQLFPHYSSDMLIAFLKSVKLCEEFDATLLKITNLEVIEGNSVSGQLLFFPALIAKKRPQHIKKQFIIGWCLKFKSGYSFSIRFLHIVLLHLAYRYSQSISSASPLLPPDLERQCSVWTNGIHWYNNDGVETLVEQVEDNRCVIMLLSCQEGAEQDMIKLHCELIGTIIKLQEEYCPLLQCNDYLLPPNLQYPLEAPSKIAAYDMKMLRSRIRQNEKYILCMNATNQQSIKISELLPVDPMRYLGIYEVS